MTLKIDTEKFEIACNSLMLTKGRGSSRTSRLTKLRFTENSSTLKISEVVKYDSVAEIRVKGVKGVTD